METPTTADIGMRLLVPVPDHETAGRLMDALQAAIGVALGHHELTGRLEFVHFNTSRWAGEDSNLRLTDYESAALTAELPARPPGG